MGCKDRHNILIDNSLIAKKYISLQKLPEKGIKPHISTRMQVTNHALSPPKPRSRNIISAIFITLFASRHHPPISPARHRVPIIFYGAPSLPALTPERPATAAPGIPLPVGITSPSLPSIECVRRALRGSCLGVRRAGALGTPSQPPANPQPTPRQPPRKSDQNTE